MHTFSYVCLVCKHSAVFPRQICAIFCALGQTRVVRYVCIRNSPFHDECISLCTEYDVHLHSRCGSLCHHTKMLPAKTTLNNNEQGALLMHWSVLFQVVPETVDLTQYIQQRERQKEHDMAVKGVCVYFCMCVHMYLCAHVYLCVCACVRMNTAWYMYVRWC